MMGFNHTIWAELTHEVRCPQTGLWRGELDAHVEISVPGGNPAAWEAGPVYVEDRDATKPSFPCHTYPRPDMVKAPGWLAQQIRQALEQARHGEHEIPGLGHAIEEAAAQDPETWRQERRARHAAMSEVL